MATAAEEETPQLQYDGSTPLEIESIHGGPSLALDDRITSVVSAVSVLASDIFPTLHRLPLPPHPQLLRLLRNSTTSLFIATSKPSDPFSEESAIVGYLQTRQSAGVLHIQEFGVSLAHRRRSIGSKLLLAALRCRSYRSRFQAASLLVRDDPETAPARSLYAKIGFRATEKKASYYQDGVDAIRMEIEASSVPR